MKSLLITSIMFFVLFHGFSQPSSPVNSKRMTPYVGILAGGCVDNPFSFLAGMQQSLTQHLALSYDVHYWNTGYKDHFEGVLSEGRFTSFTPSVKLTYSSGKKNANGFIAGAGLGYMFAKDRGTEQTYTENKLNGTYVYNDDRTGGQWDFNSIAPSFHIGGSFRVCKYPLTLETVYYFAKTAEGWMAAAAGTGIKIGLRRLK